MLPILGDEREEMYLYFRLCLCKPKFCSFVLITSPPLSFTCTVTQYCGLRNYLLLLQGLRGSAVLLFSLLTVVVRPVTPKLSWIYTPLVLAYSRYGLWKYFLSSVTLKGAFAAQSLNILVLEGNSVFFNVLWNLRILMEMCLPG